MDRQQQVGFAVNGLNGFPEASIEQFTDCRNARRSRCSFVVTNLEESSHVCFGLILSQLPQKCRGLRSPARIAALSGTKLCRGPVLPLF